MDARKMPTFAQLKAMAERVEKATASTPDGATMQDILRAADAEVAAFRGRRQAAET
jgi:hypothetical protein